MKRLCEVADCGRDHHAKGLCHKHNMASCRARNRPPEAGRGWNPDQLRRMADILDRSKDGLGTARIGEILKLARESGRSQQATTQRLVRMRAERRAGLRRRAGALKGQQKAPPWTDDQLGELSAVLDRAKDGLGAARHGELREVAERTGRSISAVRAMLHKLRRCRAAVLGSGEKRRLPAACSGAAGNLVGG